MLILFGCLAVSLVSLGATLVSARATAKSAGRFARALDGYDAHRALIRSGASHEERDASLVRLARLCAQW